jgi:hypothetical protein
MEVTILAEFFFFKIYLSFIDYKFPFSQEGITFDWTEWTTLQIRNENTLGILFYLYNFILNSSVKNLVLRCECMNVKHIKDVGYKEEDIYLGIRLLGVDNFLKLNTVDIIFL